MKYDAVKYDAALAKNGQPFFFKIDAYMKNDCSFIASLIAASYFTASLIAASYSLHLRSQFAYWVINVKSFSISRHHENLSPVSYTGSSHTGSSHTVSVYKHANEFRLSYMTFAIGLGATCLLGAITLLGGANDAHFLVECPFLPHLPHGGTVGHSYTT